MTFRGWEKETLDLADGRVEDAFCPIIISASRATDLPAYYSHWFSNRLKAGYMRWTNPFNANQVQYISFSQTRVFVFWSKNPKPLFRYLPQIDDYGVNYYFQYTLNEYDRERLEPNVAPLEKRIDTFKRLVDKIGPDRVIWRFDPLLLSESLSADELLDRIDRIANLLKGYTRKLVFSFADIETYRKVRNNLAREAHQYREFTTEQMTNFARRLSELNRSWGLELATCAEKIDLESFGIAHNRCIDDDLLIKLFPEDQKLMEFLGHDTSQLDFFGAGIKIKLKDKGQRKECGCIVSKDIGRYDTCNHLCVYCYANASRKAVENNRRRHNPESEEIIA